MRLNLVLLVSLALIASGCASLSDSTLTTEQKFKSQLNDMAQSDYHISYSVETGSGELASIGDAIDSPEIYKQGDQSKFAIGINYLGSSMSVAGYNVFSNSTTICTSGSFFGGLTGGTGSGDSSVNCQRSTQAERVSFSEEKIDEALNNISISENGTETFADRECNMYTIRPSENATEDLPSQTSNYEDGRINLCLDQQKGYPAMMSVEVNRTSELRDTEGIQEVLRMEVDEYDMEFPEGTFEIPVDLSTSVNCDPFRVNVTTFDYSGDVQISVNGGDNMTRQAESNSDESFELDENSKTSGSNEVKVYTESGEVNSDSCTDFSVDSYDFNFSS